MRKKDIISLIEKEVQYHKSLLKKEIPFDSNRSYKEGFVAGLEQAILLVGFLPTGKIREIHVTDMPVRASLPKE